MIDVGSIFSGIGAVIDSGYNIYSGNKNYELQKENMEWQQNFSERQFDYQKDLNKQIFYRNDNASQIKAKDLEKAGMSKWLAAGQGAGTGGSVSVSGSNSSQAPQQAPQLNLQNAINNAIGVYGAFQQVENVKANTELTRAQAGTEINQRRENIEANTELTRSQKDKLIQDLYIQQYNLDKSMNKGIRTTDAMNGIYNSVEAFSNMVNNEVSRSIKSIQKGLSDWFNKAKNDYKANFDKKFPGWW